MTKALRLSAIVLALTISASCTTHEAASAPPLTGPSGLAQSVTITATPDAITRDGQSQSAVVVRVFDANGQPAAGVAVRMDMLVGGSVVDFGTLGARTIATGSDGRATTVYTAPPALPTSSTLSNNAVVTISATPLGGNSQIALPFTTDIRLTPQGVILPTIRFEPLFTFLPVAANQGTPIVFDASTTKDPDSAVVSYVWDFGDGSKATGVTATHAYTRVGTFSVSLTAFDALNRGASATKAVTVGPGVAPTASFTFSPAQPKTGDPVFFSAVASSAAAGRSISSYNWDFGDGRTGSGVSVSHQYMAPGNYVVLLTVTDDVGVSLTSEPKMVPIS